MFVLYDIVSKIMKILDYVLILWLVIYFACTLLLDLADASGCVQLTAQEEATGVIYSHNSSEQLLYPNNIHKCWQITAEHDGRIELTITDFSLQEKVEFGDFCADWLRIYNGISAKERTLIHNLCGNHSNQILTSEDRYLTLIFHSDAQVSSSGFKLQYTKLQPGGLSEKDKIVIGVCVYLVIVIVIVVVASAYSCKNHHAIVSPDNKTTNQDNDCHLQSINRKVSKKFSQDQEQGMLVKLYPAYRARGSSFDSNFYFSKEEIQRKRKSLPKLFIPPPNFLSQMSHGETPVKRSRKSISKERKESLNNEKVLKKQQNRDTKVKKSVQSKSIDHVKVSIKDSDKRGGTEYEEIGDKKPVQLKKTNKRVTRGRLWPKWVYEKSPDCRVKTEEVSEDTDSQKANDTTVINVKPNSNIATEDIKEEVYVTSTDNKYMY